MYATENEMRVGELTFVPGAAGEPLHPAQAELTLGAYFLPQETVNGGVKMYRRGGAKVSHGLGGSLSR